MTIHFLERHLPRELDPQHNHPRHPEEEDIPTGLKKRRRVEFLEIKRLPGQSDRYTLMKEMNMLFPASP